MPVPCLVKSSTRSNVFASATKKAEARLKALNHASSLVLSEALKDLCKALASCRRAERPPVGAAARATRLADQLSDEKSFAADAKEQAEVAKVAATEARVAFEAADGAWTEVKLASAAHEQKVDAAKRHHVVIVAESKEAADEVMEESYQHLLHGLKSLTWMVEIAANSRRHMQKHVRSHLDAHPLLDELLDRIVHNEAFLRPNNERLAELSPHDVAAVREEGMAMPDTMGAETALAIDEGKAKMEPGVWVVPSLQEASTLAMHEEMVVREAVNLAAPKRCCAKHRASAALSFAAEKARRDLDEATADSASRNAAWSIAADRATATLVGLSLAETAEAMSDRLAQETTADVRSLQQQQARAAIEQRRLEAAVRPAEAKLVEAKSAKRRAKLESTSTSCGN